MNSPDLDLLQGTLNVRVLRALSWPPMHGDAVARFIAMAPANDSASLDRDSSTLLCSAS